MVGKSINESMNTGLSWGGGGALHLFLARPNAPHDSPGEISERKIKVGKKGRAASSLEGGHKQIRQNNKPNVAGFLHQPVNLTFNMKEFVSA